MASFPVKMSSFWVFSKPGANTPTERCGYTAGYPETTRGIPPYKRTMKAVPAAQPAAWIDQGRALGYAGRTSKVANAATTLND